MTKVVESYDSAVSRPDGKLDVEGLVIRDVKFERVSLEDPEELPRDVRVTVEFADGRDAQVFDLDSVTISQDRDIYSEDGKLAPGPSTHVTLKGVRGGAE